MDVQMPGMDGLAAKVAIGRQEQRSGGHVPIIAMTAHALSGDQERCLQPGMDGYLAKPLDRDASLDVIGRRQGLAPPQSPV
jgi:two-component system sensor histidine kinase/response regulator